MFNEFSNATTFVTVKNLPVVASLFKSAMMTYQYASNCNWYKPLQEAKTVKAIFDVFGIAFRMENNNFYPVVKNLEPIPNIKEALKGIAPYMGVGSLYVKDDYRYYTLNFDGVTINGKCRTVTDTPTTQNLPVNQPVKKTDDKKTTKANKAPKKANNKKYATTDVRSDMTISNREKSDNNTYTVQELAQELIRQIYLGNGNNFIVATADFLFKDAEKTA